MPTSDLRPMSTRSALLTVLLGAEVDRLPARELVNIGRFLGFAEPTVRVALSRMVATGDLWRDEQGEYRLSERLLDRRRSQALAIQPATTTWRGEWEMVVVRTTGRSAVDRADLRALLTTRRLAELREGVWTRPANLLIDWPAPVEAVGVRFVSRPAVDPIQLAADLWNLQAWAAAARSLLAAADTDDPITRFTACAMSGRHLLDDPVLPVELLPDDWPGAELRAVHLASREWLVQTRRTLAARERPSIDHPLQ